MIRLSKVTKRFGSREALKQVSLTLHPGEILGLLGPAGAGKTTMVRLMAGIQGPSEGKIHRPPGFKAEVGYLQDEPFVFDYLKGREMLFFVAGLHQIPRDAAQERIEHYLRLFDLDKHAERLIRSYSRVVRGKMALIGSLLHAPQYWLLDEPAAALDPAGIRVLKDLMLSGRAANQGILMATRQFGFAESLCDRVVILNRGRSVFAGTVECLRRRALSLSSLEDIYFSLASTWQESRASGEGSLRPWPGSGGVMPKPDNSQRWFPVTGP